MDGTEVTAMAAWPVLGIDLKVGDLDRCLEYYRRLGLEMLSSDPNGAGAELGTDDLPFLRLAALEHGRPRPRHMAGLYHFALLLPSDQDLASFLKHCTDSGISIDGASDHLVSQALYLSDPEGNGIEVYADRPREQWQWRDGQVRMATLPLNFGALLSRAQDSATLPHGTRVGHVHLNVSDLDASQDFYAAMGMRITTTWGPMRFLSWDGYHHHLGINLLEGQGALPVTPEIYGLEAMRFSHPGTPLGRHQDPNGIAVLT